jgi:hypothetical protein
MGAAEHLFGDAGYTRLGNGADVHHLDGGGLGRSNWRCWRFLRSRSRSSRFWTDLSMIASLEFLLHRSRMHQQAVPTADEMVKVTPVTMIWSTEGSNIRRLPGADGEKPSEQMFDR